MQKGVYQREAFDNKCLYFEVVFIGEGHLLERERVSITGYAIPKKNLIQLKMCESDVKAAMPKIINGTTALTSFQDSQCKVM